MTHYVLVTQQAWGRKVFLEAMGRWDEAWYRAEDDSTLRQELGGVRPRYAFFVNWSEFVPPDILAMSECVNFHCTALPYGRGGGPIENLILRGHTETVITAHRMVEALDAGPIYGVSPPVSLAGTKEQILDRFVDLVVSLIREIIEHEPEPYPQVGEVVVFRRLPKAEMDALWKAKTW